MLPLSFECRFGNGVNFDYGAIFEHHVVGNVSERVLDAAFVRCLGDNDKEINIAVTSGGFAASR